jgi:septal ring factor EnvC (AmiA/AmiB activator)
MTEADIPQGHLRLDGREYVAIELFEAANRHVLEQGAYCNQLIATLNELGRERRELRNTSDRLRDELDAARAELTECRRTNAAMRAAVYGAAEGL